MCLGLPVAAKYGDGIFLSLMIQKRYITKLKIIDYTEITRLKHPFQDFKIFIILVRLH